MSRPPDSPTFHRFLSALAALSVVAVLLAGCGSTSKTTSTTSPAGTSGKPAYCTSLSNLQQSVTALQGVDVKKSGTDALKSAVAEVQMNATTVVNDAKGQFETQTAALKTSVDTLSNSVKGFSSPPTSAQLAALPAQVSAVANAAKELNNSASPKCK